MQSFAIGLIAAFVCGLVYKLFVRLEKLVDGWLEKVFTFIKDKFGYQVSADTAATVKAIIHQGVALGEEIFATKNFWVFALQKARHNQLDQIPD